MKKFLVFLCLLATASVAFAQTQRGYVKTRGRLAANGTLNPGKHLSGATLVLKGNKTVVSDNNGMFTFSDPSKKYCVTKVLKNGYQLYDRDLLGKTHSYSTNDLWVVMDTPDNVLADKLASERKIRRTLQKLLNDKEDEIEALKEQQKITEEEYQKKLQALYQSQENNEKIISEMAERYSTLDFDRLDDFQRRVAAFIQNGELTRADSLLNTKGSMEERSAELDRESSAIKENAEDLKKRQEEQSKSEALYAAKLEDFAADCYRRFEICKLRHDNDSAAYYLELRASKDTTNVEWQIEAGRFLFEYLNQCRHASVYLTRALSQTNDPIRRAIVYNLLGKLCSDEGDYIVAAQYFCSAIDSWYLTSKGNPYSWDVRSECNHIDKLLEISMGAANALAADSIGNSEISQEIFDCYNSIAELFGRITNDGECVSQILFYSCRVKPIDALLPPELSKYTRTPYGEYYDEDGNTATLQFYQKYLSYLEEPMYYNPVKKAEILLEMGIHRDCHYVMGDGIDDYKSALSIYNELYGKINPKSLQCMRRIASSLVESGQVRESLYFINDTIIPIALKLYDEKSQYMKSIYYLLGLAYYDIEDYHLSSKYYQKSLCALRESNGYDEIDEADLLLNIGKCNMNLGKVGEAIESLNGSRQIFIDVEDANDYSDYVKQIDEMLVLLSQIKAQ